MGAEEGQATLHVPAGAHAHQTYLASLAGVAGRSATTQVPVIRLDDLAIAGGIRLLKIDTEGYEMSVLAGAQRLLEKCEAVLVELNPAALERTGSSEAQVVQALEERGFDPHTPTADGRLRAGRDRTAADEFQDVVFIRP